MTAEEIYEEVYEDIDKLACEANLWEIHEGACLEKDGHFFLLGDDYTEQINEFAKLIVQKTLEIVNKDDVQKEEALDTLIQRAVEKE
jgi:hypothetical protein